MRKAALLALAAAAYALAAWAVTPGFFDGIAPQEPYRWVSPPPQFKNGNLPPLPGHASFKVGSNGVVDPGTAFTGDGQASVSFIPGAFVAPPNRAPVTMDIKTESAFPDPTGIQVATNVYCVTASQPLAPGKDVLVTLRFSDQAPAPSDIYFLPDGSQSWRRLGSTGASAPYTISVRSTALGCFMAGYPADATVTASGPRVGGGQLVPTLVAVAILVVVLAGVPLAVLRRRGAETGEEAEEEEVASPPKAVPPRT